MTGYRRVILAVISTATLALGVGVIGAFPAIAGPDAGVPASAAVTTPAPIPSILLCAFPPGEGFERLGTYWDCFQCLRAGDAGVARGEWREFRCPGRPVGLDYEYDLYVR
jgi:hypothetical protein